MTKDYATTYGHKPENPGVASELASEAVSDAKAYVAETADKLKEGASNAAEQISLSAKAVKRYARNKPLEALAVSVSAAFVFGALWAIGRR